MSLILASGSPRRQELLKLITADFLVETPRCDERLARVYAPADMAAQLALRKASDVFSRHPEDLVIGADTVVSLGRERMGKPTDRAHARRMLEALSGRTHRVYTGVCVRSGTCERTFVSGAEVTFLSLRPGEIDAYVESGEGDDKAGAYAIQGCGARFVERINGDYYAVMGLPVCKLYRLLEDLAR